MPGLEKIPKEIIMAAIAKIGPVQPIDVRKELKQGDSFLIGAMLSELVSDGSLQISKVRRGGGPFYYDPKTPEKLDMIAQYLNEKDRRTYAMLKEQKVMREDAQDPLVRVGLKNMPDFSKQLDVDGVIYWRYFLTSEEEAKRLIKKPVTEKEIKQGMKEIAVDLVELKAEAIVAKAALPVPEKKTRAKKSAPETPSGTEKKPKKSKKLPEPVLMPDGAVMISPQEWLAHDTLYARVSKFAEGIRLRDARVHKPHTELTCILAVDTPAGTIDTFVHAFNRKFTLDDIKGSMPRARELGLPIIILSVDPAPSKVTAAFKGVPNIIFKKF